MNVLVYSGPEVVQISLSHTLSTLRSIVLPHYTVQTITHRSLGHEPWTNACALLVFPSCRYELSAPTSIAAIKSYVENGGALLGLGAGVRCSSRGLNNVSIGQVKADQVLHFFDKKSRIYTYPKFNSGRVPRAVAIQAEGGVRIGAIHEDHAGDILNPEGARNVKILARYVDNGDIGASAAVGFDVGDGKIILWTPCLEYPITVETNSLLPTESRLSLDEILQAEQKRKDILQRSLRDIGLQLPASDDSDNVHRPLPQFLVGHPSTQGIVARILGILAAPSPAEDLHELKDENDTFHFQALANSKTVFQETRARFEAEREPSAWQPKQIIVCSDGELPPPDYTPLFDLGTYFNDLTLARATEVSAPKPDPWGMGEALLYGEIVTSTQTMLDKNPRLLSELPAPLVSLASQQLAGRGRGTNVWLSPSGCLQFSMLLRVSLSTFPPSKLVFVQYLFGLAIVEACRTDSVLGRWGDQVRLKWPNDLYAVVGPEEGDKRKLGGILVNTSFSGGKIDIVIGSGLNVLNPPPITSLSQLVPAGVDHHLSMERTAATILAKFETMWTTFLAHRGSFQPFMNLYLERWLHSDQLVTLTTTVPPKTVRITGITHDHGLLRTVPERTGWSSGEEGFIDLQPDGNSFDLMAGLIKSKR